VAKTPRTWTGARTPSGLKRVRQAERRHEVLQPRRSAAKTYVAKALAAATQPTDSIDPAAALAEALSALDRAAKAGAIHPNAAARRKSRLTIKVNAAVGGAALQTGGRVVKTTGKAAAAKAARARIAAGKADKAKGAQTAAGKARAALSKTARAEAAAAKAAAESAATPSETTSVKVPPARATAKTTITKAATRKAATPAKAKAIAKTTAKTAPKSAAKPKKPATKG
jgi:ribosomal protein S20